jgi:hypothetical protein
MFTKGPPTSHNYFKIAVQKMLLKTFSTFNLHHGPIKVKVKEGSYVERDGLTTSKDCYFKLMGIGVLETTVEAVRQWSD